MLFREWSGLASFPGPRRRGNEALGTRLGLDVLFVGIHIMCLLVTRVLLNSIQGAKCPLKASTTKGPTNMVHNIIVITITNTVVILWVSNVLLDLHTMTHGANPHKQC